MSQSMLRAITSGIVVIGLGLLTLTLAHQPAGQAAPVPPAQPTIKVRLVLDKTEVTPGTTVRLVETIPAKSAVKVNAITHHVIRAGWYDLHSGGLVNLRPDDFVKELGAMDDGLPWIKGWSQPRALGEYGVGRRGVAFEFKPKRLGVFLIRAEWSVEAARKAWHSPPVVLVVVPPTDEHGRPVVKPEWLAKD